jgi:hypothetical protein
MKHALIQIAAAVTSILAAPAIAPAAGDDPMAAFYGNTLTIAVPDGYYFARRFVDPDGTWREPRGSAFIKGAWQRMPDGTVCHWQTEPAVHNPTRYCYLPQRREVGEEWTTTDPNTGNLVIQKIEPGRN